MKHMLVLFVFAASFAGAQPQPLTIVSAADYSTIVAPESIVSIFASTYAGADSLTLATGTFSASDQTTVAQTLSLGGVSATATYLGATYPLPLLVVTPTVINAILHVPVVVASPNIAIINVIAGSGAQFSGTAYLSPVAPTLFTADQSGTWLPAAQAIIAHADGTQTFIGSIADCTSTLVWNGITWSGCVPIPINLGASTDTATLVLYGTGFRNANDSAVLPTTQAGGGSALSLASAVLGQAKPGPVCAVPGVNGCYDLPVQYAGAQSSFYGLDQVNIELPHYLAGTGIISIEVNIFAGLDSADASTLVYIDIQ